MPYFKKYVLKEQQQQQKFWKWDKKCNFLESGIELQN